MSSQLCTMGFHTTRLYRAYARSLCLSSSSLKGVLLGSETRDTFTPQLPISTSKCGSPQLPYLSGWQCPLGLFDLKQRLSREKIATNYWEIFFPHGWSCFTFFPLVPALPKCVPPAGDTVIKCADGDLVSVKSSPHDSSSERKSELLLWLLQFLTPNETPLLEAANKQLAQRSPLARSVTSSLQLLCFTPT